MKICHVCCYDAMDLVTDKSTGMSWYSCPKCKTDVCDRELAEKNKAIIAYGVKLVSEQGGSNAL